MEIAPCVYLNQTPDMGLVLSDEFIIAVVSSGSQYGYVLSRILAKS